MATKGAIFQSVDALDIIGFLETKNKRIQATFLGELEQIIDKNSAEFKQIRKIFLDQTNGYMRSVETAVFGTVERD